MPCRTTFVVYNFLENIKIEHKAFVMLAYQNFFLYVFYCMKIKNLILSLTIIMPLISCSDKHGAVNEMSLEGQIVKIDSMNEDSRPMWLLGDNLYARDAKFNLISGKISKIEWEKSENVFVAGHGHNEFGLMALTQDKNGTLYVLDRPFNGDKLVSFTKIKNTDSIAAIKDQIQWEKYDLLDLPPFYMYADNFEVISDSTILVPGAPANDMRHLFSIVNFKRQTVTPLDYWPDDSTPENQVNETFLVYTAGSGVKGNGRDRFLYWDDSGKVASIFTIDGTKVNILNHIYSDVLPTQSSGKTPLTERIFCCSDSNRIYLLFKDSNGKGEKIEKYDISDPFPMGNTVEVYDWDGVKQQVIHLDKYGRTLMLSKDSKTLYLYSEWMADESKPYIYSYDLSSLK